MKEAININDDKDEHLCSFHLKTAMLWEIVKDPRAWSPHSILVRFWKCFERLIRWVNEEYCPNFFIPENNVMMGKFNRITKTALLRHLTTLYSEGYSCLLRCPSLYTHLSIIIGRPQIVRVMPSDFMEAKVWTDFYTIKECFERVPACLSFDNVDLLIRIANRLPQFAETYQSDIECFGIQTWTFYLLCNIYLLYIWKLTDHASIKNKLTLQTISRLLGAMDKNRVDMGYHYISIAIGMHRLGGNELAVRRTFNDKAYTPPHLLG